MPKRGFKKRIWNKVSGLFSLRGAKHRLAVRSELKEPNCYQQKETDQNTMHCLMSSATTPHNKPRGIRFSKRAVQRSKYLRQKLGVRKTVMGFSPRVGSITEEDENEITLWMLAENAEDVISDGITWLRDVEESYGDDAGMDQERHEEILQMWIESNSFDRLTDDEDSDNSDGNSDEQHDNYCSDIEDDDDEQDWTHDDDDYDDDDPTYQDDSVDNSKKQHCGDDDDDDDEQDRTHGDNDFDDDPINQDASDDNNEKQHCNDDDEQDMTHDDDDDNAISQDDSNDNSDERYGLCFNSNNDGQSSHDVSDKRKQHNSSDYDDDDCDDDDDSEDKQSESSTNDNDEYTTYSTNNSDIILSKQENDNKLSRNFNEINNVADKDCHDYFLKTKLNSDGNNDVSGEKNTLANSSDLCSAVETTRSCNVDKGLRHDCTRKDILDSPSEDFKLSLDNCNSIGIGNMNMSFELDLNVSEKISSDPKYCDDDEYDDHDECNYDGDAQADNISNSSDVKATKKSNMNSELDDDDHGNNNYPTIHNNTFTVTKTKTTKQSYHDVDNDDDNDDDGNDDDDSISNSSHNFSTKDDIKDSILKDSLNSNSLNHKIHGNQATSTSEKLDHNHNKEGKIKSKINEEDNTICNDPVLCAVKEEIDGILNRISNIASDFSLMKKTMNEMKASDVMNSTKT